MIQYRLASQEDFATIAHLHSESWRHSYRGILSDDYLDHFVRDDRLSVWQSRFSTVNSDSYCLIAEMGNIPCGFACTFLRHDADWGALLDNLHVLPSHQNRGIGAKLLKKSARWVWENDPDSPFYLWVYVQNAKARAFYEKMGCQYEEIIEVENPDRTRSEIIRCIWPNATQFPVI